MWSSSLGVLLVSTLAQGQTAPVPAPAPAPATSPAPSASPAPATGAPASSSGGSSAQASAKPVIDAYLVHDAFRGTWGFDRPLPAGKPLTLQVVSSVPLASGGLEVWQPRGGAKNRRESCPEAVGEVGRKQIALRLSEGALVGTLPPLPSGTAMCARVEAWSPIDDTASAGVVRALQGALDPYVLADGKKCGELVVAAPRAGAPAQAVQAVVDTLVGHQVDLARVGGLVDGLLPAAKNACDRVVALDGEAAALQASQPPDAATVSAATGTPALPPIRTSQGYRPFAAALSVASAAELEAASAALAGTQGVDTAAWRKILDRAAKGTKNDRAEAERSTRTPGVPLVLSSSGTYVPWSAVWKDTSLVETETVTAQARATWGAGSSEATAVQVWMTANDGYVAGVSRLRAIQTERDAIRSKFREGVVLLQAQPIALRGLGGELVGTTQLPGVSEQKGSYFSPAFGAGPAVAFGGSEPVMWAVPYVGLDVYFAPIDRALPLREVGGFFRHVGLFVGLTAYAPLMDVPNREVAGLLDGVTLVAGPTVRVGRFGNVSVPLVPYRVLPANPLEDPGQVAVAAGVALSFDLDLWNAVSRIDLTP